MTGWQNLNYMVILQPIDVLIQEMHVSVEAIDKVLEDQHTDGKK